MSISIFPACHRPPPQNPNSPSSRSEYSASNAPNETSIRSKLAEIFVFEKLVGRVLEMPRRAYSMEHLTFGNHVDSPTLPNTSKELHKHDRPVRCLEYELGQSVSLLVVCSTWFDVFFIRKSAGGDVSLPLFHVWTTRIQAYDVFVRATCILGMLHKQEALIPLEQHLKIFR
jgi:hypothetical protein